MAVNKVVINDEVVLDLTGDNKMPGRYLKLRQNARDDTCPAFCVK